jgi:hypothetical protein
MKFFKISGRSIFPADWGDYGDILQHGMSSHRRRVNGRLSLERTGPQIPPITLPGIGDIIAAAEARNQLEATDLTGFTFVPVEKALIVELHWETWNLSSAEPPELPESGEPEDYILGGTHSQTASEALGELWEIAVPLTVSIFRPQPIVSSYKDAS